MTSEPERPDPESAPAPSQLGTPDGAGPAGTSESDPAATAAWTREELAEAVSAETRTDLDPWADEAEETGAVAARASGGEDDGGGEFRDGTAARGEAGEPETPRASRATFGSRGRRSTTAADGTNALARTLRILGGVGVLALTAGVGVGAWYLPSAASTTSMALAVAVPPTDVAVACPGPLESNASSATDLELGGASEVTSEVVGAVVAHGRDLEPATLGPLDAPGIAASGSTQAALAVVKDPTEPTVLRASPGELAAFAVASFAQRASAGDLRGIAAVSCPLPSSSAWFAAGSTELGDSAILQVVNPGSTATTVTLRAWGATGEIALSTASLVLDAGTSSEVVLEGIAPDEPRIVVQATARGGRISATLQVRSLDGLTPAGVDVVAPTTGPATAAVVPGVVLGSSSVDDDDPALVRIANPSDEPATVLLDLLGAEGVVPLNADGGIVIEPGSVVDITLAGAPAGTYSLRVGSTVPVVSGVQLVRVGQPAPEDPSVPVAERTWLPAVAATENSATAIPSIVEGALLVVASADTASLSGTDEAPSEADDSLGSGDVGGSEDPGAYAEAPQEGEARPVTVTVTALGAAGDELGTRTLDVPAWGSVALDLAASFDQVPTVVLVDGESPVSSAVVLSASDELGELVSVLPAQPDPQEDRSVALRLSLD